MPSVIRHCTLYFSLAIQWQFQLLVIFYSSVYYKSRFSAVLFLWCLVAGVVGVPLVGMIVLISLGSRATVARCVSFIFGMVGVTLVGMVVLVRLVSCATVSTSTRHS